jgi:FlaA1/EpsC-like NDP-sugar epimerase
MTRDLDIAGARFNASLLLGRAEWRPAHSLPDGDWSRRCVAVTGAAGSLGRALTRRLSRRGVTVVAIDSDEARLDLLQSAGLAEHCVLADVSDMGALRAIMRTHRPRVVYHLAAKKHVKFAEDCATTAIRTNVLGTAAVLEAARDAAVEHVVIASSDKAVSGASVMGRTKRVVEMLSAHAMRRPSPRVSVVRFCNVLGSSGSVLHHFVRASRRSGSLVVWSANMTRWFCTIGEAVDLLIEASAEHRAGKIVVLETDAPLAIVDLANRSAAALGREVRVRVVESLDPAHVPHEALWAPGERVRRATHTPGVAEIAPTPLDCFDVESALARLSHHSADGQSMMEVLDDWAARWNEGRRERVHRLVVTGGARS